MLPKPPSPYPTYPAHGAGSIRGVSVSTAAAAQPRQPMARSRRCPAHPRGTRHSPARTPRPTALPKPLRQQGPARQLQTCSAPGRAGSPCPAAPCGSQTRPGRAEAAPGRCQQGRFPPPFPPRHVPLGHGMRAGFDRPREQRPCTTRCTGSVPQGRRGLLCSPRQVRPWDGENQCRSTSTAVLWARLWLYLTSSSREAAQAVSPEAH